MYERLVDQAQTEVQGFVAYGQYKKAKREWIRQFEARKKQSPSPAEEQAYVDGFTPQMIAAFETTAASALAGFTLQTIEEARPEIEKEVLRGTTGRSIMIGLATNAIYTGILIVVALILALAGVDILSIFQNVRATNGS
jgi:hypothetical protein